MPRGDTTIIAAATIATGPGDMDQLIAVAAQWGLEAGFLGLDGHVEARMQMLLHDTQKRLFGDFEAERDRLMAELNSAETAWSQTQQVIARYRSRYGEGPRGERAGRLRQLRNWVWQTRDYRSANAISRREAPVLRELRRGISNVERTQRAAHVWRETAIQGLKATFEFQRQRAAMARARKEEHDNADHNTKQFIARRAS